MIMSLQQQQKDAATNNLQQNQRPPRSNRVIKTSQGTRSRHTTKPLLTPTIAQQQQTESHQQDLTFSGGVLAYSDPYNTVAKYSSPAVANLIPFQQKSFNGLLNDFARKSVPRRVSHKTRKTSGQVTLFQQVGKMQRDSSQFARVPSSERRSSSRQKKRSNRSRSRSSQKSMNRSHQGADSDCETPVRSRSKDKDGRRSLNFGKRAQDQNKISADNMRFVAKLINVKATVPHGLDMLKRDAHQKQLRKNLKNSSFNSAGGASSSLQMMQQQNSSQIRRSLQGTPTSVRSQDRQKQSPQVKDSRLKAKALQNFYKIKQGNDGGSAKSSPEKQQSHGTPNYLKHRVFDPKNLAQMYEADDHLLFGDKFIKNHKKRNNKVSDTASRASSRSSQGSVRRRKKKAKRRFGGLGETGSDQAAVVSSGGLRQIGSSNGLDEPIVEHPGPKPNPASNSLIEKMNHLMTQKQQKRSKGNAKSTKHHQAKASGQSNLAEQVQQMLVTDHDNYDTEDLQSYNMQNAINEKPENDDDYVINSKQAQQKKPFVMKMSRSNPRHHSKRKSLQNDCYATSNPFAANQATLMGIGGSQKAAMLQGFYNSQTNQQRTNSKPIMNSRRQRVASSYLPPRNVKTATIRKTGQPDIAQTYAASYDYLAHNSQKQSPHRNVHLQHLAYPRTANNVSSVSQATGARRRIIVAKNKQDGDDDMAGCNINNYTIPMARHTDSGWNRQRKNLTEVENNTQIRGAKDKAGAKPVRTSPPQSAHPTTSAQKMRQQQPIRAYQQQQDIRKKHLAEKLFSPVLKSQVSSSVAASVPFDPHTIGVDSVGEPVIALDPDGESTTQQDALFQGGLRPRVTRTAEGGTRPRIKQSNDYDQSLGMMVEPNNLLPTILSKKDANEAVPIQKLLDSNSSLEERQKQSMKAGFAPSVGAANRRTPQLNVESADTFNCIMSAHNIQEEDAFSDAINEQQETHQSAAMLFTAPKSFNQISEEGGDSDEEEDGEDKGNAEEKDQQKEEGEVGEEEPELQNDNAAVLPKNYPRLL